MGKQNPILKYASNCMSLVLSFPKKFYSLEKPIFKKQRVSKQRTSKKKAKVESNDDNISDDYERMKSRYENNLNAVLDTLDYDGKKDESFRLRLISVFENNLVEKDWIRGINKVTNSLNSNFSRTRIIISSYKDLNDIESYVIDGFCRSVGQNSKLLPQGQYAISQFIQYIYAIALHNYHKNQTLDGLKSSLKYFKLYMNLITVSNLENTSRIVELLQWFLVKANIDSEPVVDYMNHIIQLGYVLRYKSNASDYYEKYKYASYKDNDCLYAFCMNSTMYDNLMNKNELNDLDIPVIVRKNEMRNGNILQEILSNQLREIV
jgi:hypothetical protein